MKKSNTFLLLVWVVLLIPAFLDAGLPQTLGPGNAVEIRMTARKYTFHPDVITVNKGDRVQLVITAMDHDHGIAIPAFGVNQRLKRGVPTTVSFVASKTGIFPFHCSVFCGLGHRHMKGKLVVKPRSTPGSGVGSE